MNLKTSKLGDVCDIRSGNSIPAKEKDDLYRNVSEGLPYVATKDIGFDGSINFENGVKIPAKLTKRFRLSKKNSVLVCAEGGSAGRKIAYSNQDCYFVNKLFSIKPTTEIDSKYIYFYTLSNEFQKKFKESLHGLIGGVSLSKIKNFQITYPTLAEQQRIVAKLDAAFAEIDKIITIKKSTEKNIEKLKSSILNNFLNNNFLNTKIGDICELIYGKGLPKEKRVNENGIPAYGANGIKCYASEPLYNRPSIIIGRKGSAGELQWVDNPFWALDVTYYVLPNEKKVNLKFLYYLLQMQNLPKLAKGVKPGINRNEVYNINIKLPTIDEQINITDRLEKIFKQQKILKELNDRINVNYHSLKLAIISKEIKNKAA